MSKSCKKGETNIGIVLARSSLVRTIVDAFTVRCKARIDDTYVAQNTWLGKTIRKSYQLALIFQTAVLFPFQGKVKQAL